LTKVKDLFEAKYCQQFRNFITEEIVTQRKDGAGEKNKEAFWAKATFLSCTVEP